jgi:hypothetical protein
MLGRRPRSALKGKPVVQAGSWNLEKTAETVQELAGRAAVAAREAQRVAAPAIRSAAQEAQRVAVPVIRSAAHTSAETLSHAAEKASEILADAAERLAAEVPSGDGLAGKVGGAAAGVASSVAKAVRPRRWRRRARRLLIVSGTVGAVYVILTKTPLKGKISELVFGPPLDEEEPEPITLPVSGSPVESVTTAPASGETAQAAAEAAGGEQVASGAPADDGASQ